jgi:hypothetical protein
MREHAQSTASPDLRRKSRLSLPLPATPVRQGFRSLPLGAAKRRNLPPAISTLPS